MPFFHEHPYLASSLILAAQAALALVLLPRARGRALVSGLLVTPSSLLSFAFVPDYWRPARVAALVVGPEDLLFSFSTGVLVWLVAERFGGRRLLLQGPRPLSLDPVVRRHFRWSLPFLAVFLLSWAAGVRPMNATLLASAVVLARLAGRTRGAWPLALAGALGFTALHAATLHVSFAAWPHFADQWSRESLWGVSLGAIPAEELAWAAAFGAVWPLTLADAFGARRSGEVVAT
mgnify:CR=1 FL=1